MLPASAASKTRGSASPDQISSLLGTQLIAVFLDRAESSKHHLQYGKKLDHLHVCFFKGLDGFPG